MSQLIENYNTEVNYAGGINTNKPATFGSTVSTGTQTITGSQTISGATIPTGGITPNNQPLSVEAVPIGSVAYSSFGGDLTPVTGSMNVISCYVPVNFTATNINMLQGSAGAGTTKYVGVIYNVSGTAVANSTLGGIVAAATNSFLTLPLTSTVSLVGPGRYYVGIQNNGINDNIRVVQTQSFVGVATSTVSMVFGTTNSITVPTTFTGSRGCIVYLN